jgi:hypothetical protein
LQAVLLLTSYTLYTIINNLNVITQINGGDVAAKVAFARGLFEKEVTVDSVFNKDECIDILGATKGHGTEGVVTRWGVTRLARKTHRGLRKVRLLLFTFSNWSCVQCQTIGLKK